MMKLMDLVSKHAENIAGELGGSKTSASNSSGSSSCFIATACFGSANDSTVLIYRNYRESVLKKSSLGRRVVLIYYKLSPQIADYLRGHPSALRLVRRGLFKLSEYLK